MTCLHILSDTVSTGSGDEQKVNTICRLLIQEYGDIIVERALDPIEELVFAILSQNTADINSERAFKSLQSAYATWEEVLVAPHDELAQVIRSSGPFRVKAERIQATLAEIKKRVGSLNLSVLEDMEPSVAMDWLTSLHGVGPKTAAIVLLFCFEKPVLPVDTHVWRVSKRLGIVPSKASRVKAQALLQEIIPHTCLFSMNHNLVKHGREVCIARKPLCEECFLKNLCSYYQSLH
ncbi:MAG: endonuclease III domain-containing protein [Candidatus Thorarchaeota archaeon]|jgi:endonuclease-3